jgi:hypothetical protein
MKIGTKSLLFGCHQVLIHPPFVYAAWVKCYHRLPNLKETICIVIHDWGYFGKPNMDGPEGESHPIWAAGFAARWLDHDTKMVKGKLRYATLCMYHSRFMARSQDTDVSKLCLPDKVGVGLMPVWLWVTLGNFSGEIYEYMHQKKYEINQNAGPSGVNYSSKFEFFRAYKKIAKKWFETKDVTINKYNIVSAGGHYDATGSTDNKQ